MSIKPEQFPLLMPCDTATWLDYQIEAEAGQRKLGAAELRAEFTQSGGDEK